MKHQLSGVMQIIILGIMMNSLWILTMSCTRKIPTKLGTTAATVQITGYAQKGPFITGTTVSVQELDDTFNPDGQIYNAGINSTTGAYALAQPLTSNYLSCIIEGYYYNEITGELSDGPVTLRALATTLDSLTVNINVLTTLAYDRIISLMQNGEKFTNARAQAEQEILKGFQMMINQPLPFHKMTLHKTGDSHAALLAASVILQGDLNAEDLNRLIADLCEDFKADGLLNIQENQDRLMSNIRGLNLTSIRTNMENLWTESDTTLPVPAFEKYATNMIEFTVLQTIPEDNATDISPNTTISLSLSKAPDQPDYSNLIQVSSDQTSLSGQISFDISTNTLTLSPDSLLEYGSTYTVLLMDTIKSADGSTLAPGYTWQFSTAAQPALMVTPLSVDFGETLASQTVSLTNTGTNPVFWQANTSQHWISLSLDSDSLSNETDQITVTVNRQELLPGAYQGTVTISSAIGTQIVNVTMTVPEQPELSLSHNALSFGSDTLTKQLLLQNIGTGTLNWQLSTDETWVQIDRSTGSTTSKTDTIKITLDKSGLSVGHHTGQLLLSAGDTSVQIIIHTIQDKAILLMIADSTIWQDTDVWDMDCASLYAQTNGTCRTTNFARDSVLRVITGTWEAETATYRTYMQFSPVIPWNVQIDSAFLELHALSIFGDNNMRIDRVTTPWQENTLNWDNQPNIAGTTNPEDYININWGQNQLETYEINMTKMIQYWRNHPQENYGIRMAHIHEIRDKSFRFYSSEVNTLANRPCLKIYVTYPNL